MKRLIYILVSGLLLACSGYKIIPDEQLALIFHDAFLSNAYMQHRGMRPDSLNLYEPIFAKYGYTTADVQYTIGNFSKRKSARLSDVVEQAIKLLETEAEHLDREVSILDTIDNVARRTFRRTLYADSLVRVTRLRDTARLRFVFDSIRPGDYTIAFDYLIDSLDENTQLRASVWFERADDRRVNVSPTYLTRRRAAEYRREMKADTSMRRLVLDLYEIRSPKPKRPHMTVRNLRVVYTPDAAEDIPTILAGEFGAGRMQHGDLQWHFDNAVDDRDYDVNSALKAAVTGYKTSLVGLFTESGDEGSGGGDGGDEGGDENPPVIVPGQGYECHFTGSKPSNSFYTFTSANYSNSKGSATVNGTTYTECLKLESSTIIGFTTTEEMTLTLIFNEGSTPNIKIDGVKISATSGSNIITHTLPAGAHKLTKADQNFLFYINLGSTSGLNEIKADHSNGTIYDLLGRPVNEPQPGNIYMYKMNTKTINIQVYHSKNGYPTRDSRFCIFHPTKLARVFLDSFLFSYICFGESALVPPPKYLTQRPKEYREMTLRNLFFLIAFCTSIYSWGESLLSVSHYSIQEGLSQNTVQSIIQDNEGYIWLATWNGLEKFDGYRFKNYKSYPTDSIRLSYNRITHIEKGYGAHI